MNKLTAHRPRLEARHLDEIRTSVDWQALFVGVGLREDKRKSKADDLWAFSPFHDEKTASFHMRPGAIWYDFSIGEGGGPLELIQKLENCNCFEAAHILMERGWATCSADMPQPVARQRATISRDVEGSIAPDGAPQNAPIRQDLLTMCDYHPYLTERGISEATCGLLGIGFLPQGRSTLRGRLVCQVADARVTTKSEGQLTRVILSHLGRAIDDTEPKYLFYQGFHKSAELYGQELIWLHEDAAEQIKETGALVLTEGPFDVAKAVEAGLRNVVASFGASLSANQTQKLKAMADAHGATSIHIAYDRDEAGRQGAVKAAEQIRDVGLTPVIFDWNAPVGRNSAGDVFIPKTTSDLADFSTKQLIWLRAKGLI